MYTRVICLFLIVLPLRWINVLYIMLLNLRLTTQFHSIIFNVHRTDAILLHFATVGT